MKVWRSPFVSNFAKAKSKTVEELHEEFSGWCIDFAGELSDFVPGSRLAYFDKLESRGIWKYHAAMEYGGWIHDLWYPMLPLNTFMLTIGAKTVEYPAE